MNRPSNKTPPKSRNALWVVVASAISIAVVGCAGHAPGPPSILEQTVDAMDQENWDRADHLLSHILPPVPEDMGGED